MIQQAKYGDYEYKPAHDRWQLDPDRLAAATPALRKIEAQRYFVTSGDAVAKTRILVRDLRRAGADESAELVQRLLNKLVELRASDVFMETEWTDRKLLVIAKNPREI